MAIRTSTLFKANPYVEITSFKYIDGYYAFDLLARVGVTNFDLTFDFQAQPNSGDVTITKKPTGWFLQSNLDGSSLIVSATKTSSAAQVNEGEIILSMSIDTTAPSLSFDLFGEFKDRSETLARESIELTQDPAITLHSWRDASQPVPFELANSQLVVAPPKNKDEAGINLSDVIASLKLFLGLSLPETYRSPYNYVAADLDGNGKVELADVIGLLKVFLNLPVTNTKAMEWVIVQADQVQAANGESLGKDNATPVTFDVEFAAGTDVALVGILRGDVDGSWQTDA